MLEKILDGKYRLIRKVGAGGMGCVYEAEQLATGDRYAVKIVTPTQSAKDATLIRRFHREARAATAADSPHIGRVVDTGTCPEDGVPYMVMELLSGEDLSGLFKRVGMLSADLTLRIAAQVLMGLQKAHAAGIVHRDIKPANIYLSRQEDPNGGSPRVIAKVLDFGVAKMVRDQAISTETGGLTRTGSMIGSPLYMSPEQARGSKVIDERADIWSLGIVLFEALTGRTPFHHIDALGELILAICSELPPVVQDYAPWVPKEIASVIHRALSLDVSCRPQTAQAFLEEVQALLTDGHEITEDMLVSVDEQARSRVAPRLDISHAATAMSAGTARLVSSPDLVSSGAVKHDRTVRIDSGAGSHPGASSQSRDGTHQGVTHGVTDSVELPKRSPRGIILVASAAVLLASGIGGYATFGPPSNAATPPVDAAAALGPQPAAATDETTALPPPTPESEPTTTEAETPEDAAASAEPSAKTPSPPDVAAGGPAGGPVSPRGTPPPRRFPGGGIATPPPSKPTTKVDTEGFGDRK